MEMIHDFLKLDQLTEGQIRRLTQRAETLAQAWEQGADAVPQSLRGRRIGLIVDDTGWRNTSAFQLGLQSMGAHCVQIPASLSGAEPATDLARYLDNWYDLLGIRTPQLSRLEELAAAARAPVVNLRTRQNHPCETLGDLSYIRGQGRDFAGLRVVAVAPADNIIHSWAEAARVLPITLTQVFARQYHMDPHLYAGRNIHCTEDMSALQEADVIVTDCFPKHAEIEPLLKYQVTVEALDGAAPDCLFIPCPPVSRGQEVSAGAMGHVKCVVTAAKAYLLHAQNALVEAILTSPSDDPVLPGGP